MKKIILFLIFLLFLPSIALAPVWPIKTRASQVRANTSNFDVNLSSTDTNVQTALDTLDELTLTGGTTTFLGLTDTPSSWDSGKYFKSWTSSGTWETPAGAGDMLKATYDTGSNDVVDNSEALGGYAYTHFLDTTTADSTYLKKSEDDSTNYKLTLSSLAVTNTATVGSLSSSGQVTSNSRKLIDQYDYAVCISTPNALSTIATFISPFRSYAVTISTISAQIIGGTNVVFMIEQRTIAGIESAGTDIWSGDVTALPNIWTGGTASDFTVPADNALVLVITSVSGNVDRFMLKYGGTKD